MYDDAVLRIPSDEPQLWEILQEQFLHVSEDFARPVETKEDALTNKFHRENDGKTVRDSLRAVRYRNVGNELGNRDYFLSMGRELLPYISQTLERERLTPEFVQQWGKLMFCHGYVASHILDDSDDLSPQRAGAATAAVRSKDTQRKWIAHHMVPLLNAGHPRANVEALVVTHIQKIRATSQFPANFPEKWFRAMITHGELTATYDQKHFSAKAMRALCAEGVDDIPPVSSLFP